MTEKADFNADEWSQVLEGPLMAGVMVIGADRGGTIKESLAMGKAYAESRQERAASPLLDAIVSSNPQLDPKSIGQPSDLRQHGTERLRNAVRTVEAKASTEEAQEYKRFIHSLADRVARAHKEGGILGLGGKEISEQEQTALADIDTALGI